MSKSMLQRLPIGIDDFRDLRVGGYYYADKSLFIKELIDAGPSKVCLIPRPRRFGKTLNMTMLKYFFEKTENSNRYLFDGLAVTEHAECMKYQGQHPVIFLTCKDVKSDTWEECYDKITAHIGTEFNRHKYLYTSNVLDEFEKKSFYSILDGTASQGAYENSLKDLSSYLHKHHGAKPLILIDEYDSPIHAGFINGYYAKVVSFMRGLMCGGLKGNTNLAYGVVTGIMRVAKESIFSGMNNLDVNTFLSTHYADHFGLLEHEVVALLQEQNIDYDLEKVRAWYNGYAVGGIPKDEKSDQPYIAKIYNPWSIVNFAKNRGVFGIYWVNTSDNKLIQDLIRKAPESVKSDFELILKEKSVTKTICEDIVFTAIDNDTNALWSFLMFGGYLTWKSREPMQVKCKADLVAPNYEVLDCFKTLIDRTFSESMGSEIYHNMLEALREGNVPAFERYFQQSIIDSMSYFDVSGRTPERVYHAYVLGMLIGLNATHEVKSNRESGLGRYDVCLIPKNISKPGIIIEFKVFNKKEDPDIEVAAQRALEQIEEKKYEAELRSRGIQRIIKLAIIFEGKKALIVTN